MSHAFPFRQIGDFQLTALSDGTMSASLELLSGIKTADADAIQCSAGIDKPGDIHINSYLIRGRRQVILVDTGAGAPGQLISNLAAAGVSPDEVDTVLLTHCHPDHIGGLLNAAKEPVFKRAEIILHPLEAQYWRDETKREMANERGQRNFLLARQTLQAYAPNIHFFNGEKIAGGILPIWLPGHTPGHTGFLIESERERLLIWGDIVHYPHIQSAQPAVSILFDVDPAQAEATRKQIMQQAASEKLLIAGMHLNQTGFARVSREGCGYRIDYTEK